MINDILSITFSSTFCNGYPNIRVSLADKVLYDTKVNNSLIIKIPLSKNVEDHILFVERYGKNNQNYLLVDNVIIKDQILEIISIKINDIEIPEFILNKDSKFEFNNNCHFGSKYFGPNGLWSFNFKTPVVTHLLDTKIEHESKYNQDFMYPWSYKFGPGQADHLANELNQLKQKVLTIL